MHIRAIAPYREDTINSAYLEDTIVEVVVSADTLILRDAMRSELILMIPREPALNMGREITEKFDPEAHKRLTELQNQIKVFQEQTTEMKKLIETLKGLLEIESKF